MKSPGQRGAFGDWLKAARERRYRTQKDALAAFRRLGGFVISPSEYAQWESGSRVPREDNPKVARLYEFFGSRPSEDAEPEPPSVDVAAAIDRQTDALRDLAAAIRETFVMLDARSQDRAVELARYLARIAETVGVPDESAGAPASTRAADPSPGRDTRHRTQRGRKARVGPPRPGWEDEPVAPELETRSVG